MTQRGNDIIVNDSNGVTKNSTVTFSSPRHTVRREKSLGHTEADDNAIISKWRWGRRCAIQQFSRLRNYKLRLSWNFVAHSDLIRFSQHVTISADELVTSETLTRPRMAPSIQPNLNTRVIPAAPKTRKCFHQRACIVCSICNVN